MKGGLTGSYRFCEARVRVVYHDDGWEGEEGWEEGSW